MRWPTPTSPRVIALAAPIACAPRSRSRPADTALRHTVASMFADARHYRRCAGSIRHAPPSSAHRARCCSSEPRLRLALGDRAGARIGSLGFVEGCNRRLTRSLLLGDLLRERGDYRGARSMYVGRAARCHRRRAHRRRGRARTDSIAKSDRRSLHRSSATIQAGASRKTPPLTTSASRTPCSASAARCRLPQQHPNHVRRRMAGAVATHLGAERRRERLRRNGRRLAGSGLRSSTRPVRGRRRCRAASDGWYAGRRASSTVGLAVCLAGDRSSLATQPAYPSLFSVDALLPATVGLRSPSATPPLRLAAPIGRSMSVCDGSARKSATAIDA